MMAVSTDLLCGDLELLGVDVLVLVPRSFFFFESGLAEVGDLALDLRPLLKGEFRVFSFQVRLGDDDLPYVL